MYAKQTFPSSRQELAIWQPWRVGPGGTNYRGLGDATSILASIVPSTGSLDVNTTYLYAGVGLLGLAAILHFGGKAITAVRKATRRGKRRR